MDVFNRLDQAVVIDEPFPYVVVENFLEPDVCQKLLGEMPSLDVLTRGEPLESNKRFTLSQKECLGHIQISETWREVLRQGMSQEFLNRIVRLFGSHISREFPDFSQRFAALPKLRVLPRSSDKRPSDTVGLDAQIAVNTPVLTEGTTVRGPHLDRTNKLFIGLLYLRPEYDDSVGGDLELYAPTDPQPTFGPKRMLPREAVKLIRTVPYRCNTLVLFLNTPQALHGVSPRGTTRHPRYFLNLVGEMSEPLFDIPILDVTVKHPPRQNWLSRLLRGRRPSPTQTRVKESVR